MPRPSVDIDVAYLPAAARPKLLSAIIAAMEHMAERFREGLPDVRVDQDRCSLL